MRRFIDSRIVYCPSCGFEGINWVESDTNNRLHYCGHCETYMEIELQ